MDLFEIAMRQSALDLGCLPTDFLQHENIIVPFSLSEKAKSFYSNPISCHFVSYGNNIVAAATGDIFSVVDEYIHRYTFYHCFETPNLHWLNENLRRYGQGVCFMAEYWLPKTATPQPLPCRYKTKVLHQEDFSDLYIPEWSNALCEKRKHLDMLGVGAFDGEKMVGLAACSADCNTMWQIGVDVLPAYRRQNIACALTSRLAAEIINCGKVPFYCCAWSNIASAGNAVQSGFVPAWAEMTVKPLSLIQSMNEI